MKINIITTTTDSNKTARHIGLLLIKNNLSPCVQILPKIQSIYNWKGKLEKSEELLLYVKTIPEKVNDCKRIILDNHNYDVPELIVFDGIIMFDEYREWFINIVQ